jgi:polysaccharide pyruvyl transferase WcaK-like protein
MIHHVYANQKNIGDWLSGRAIQSLLNVPVTEHLCDEPFVPQTMEALGKLAPGDTVVIGGGGLFMDYFAPFWEKFLPIAGRVKFCIWGVGYCDQKGQPSRAPTNLLENVIRRSSLCIVRDELTRHHLAACDLPPPVCCPTINLVATRPPGTQLLHVDAWGDVGEANYEFMETVARDLAARTGRKFEHMNNEIVHPGSEKLLDAALDKYATADLILTSRLHGCIIGLAMGRKVLAVSCDRKIESFMEAAGLKDWVIDIANVREQLPAKIEALSDQPDVSAFIENVRIANREVARRVRAIAEGSN